MPMVEASLKTEVRNLLHYGKDNAQKGRVLAKLLNLKNDRPIRIAIRDLIAEGVPIASSVSAPYGYFIANSPEEAKAYVKVVKSRLVEDAYRCRDFKVAASKLLKPCQLGLF